MTMSYSYKQLAQTICILYRSAHNFFFLLYAWTSLHLLFDTGEDEESKRIQDIHQIKI